jgi:hypothetical protein
MKTFTFWSDNPATQRAEMFLRLRRQFPQVPASEVLAFVRMVRK